VYGSTGWELLMLPASLMVGLIVVAAGLLMAAASRRKDARSEPGEQQVA